MSNNHSPSFDEIRGILKELSVSQKETDQQIKELSASQKETDQQIKELSANQKETERQMRESREETELLMRKSREETDRQIRKTRGVFDSRWGQLVESLVSGKLVALLQSRGIEVMRHSQRVSARYIGEDGVLKEKEFDIVAVNGREVVVTEVKATLTPKKVTYFIDSVKDFKRYFPEYSNHIVYAAVAYLKSDSEAHIFAERHGLLVVKATGDSASIINRPDFKPRAF